MSQLEDQTSRQPPTPKMPSLRLEQGALTPLEVASGRVSDFGAATPASPGLRVCAAPGPADQAPSPRTHAPACPGLQAPRSPSQAPPSAASLATSETGAGFSAAEVEAARQLDAERERQLVQLLSSGPLGFEHGRPVAALAVFRCAVDWRAFQKRETTFFDQVTECIQRSVHVCLGDVQGVAPPADVVSELSYWLSVAATLLALMQRHARPSPGAAPGKAGATPGSSSKMSGLLHAFQGKTGWVGGALAMLTQRGQSPALPPGPAAAGAPEQGGDVRFEAKYPALLFKQQMDAHVTKIFTILRDHVKKAITPLLPGCMQAPKGAAAGKGAAAAQQQQQSSQQQQQLPWQQLVAVLDQLLRALRDNHVPRPIVRRLFSQLALDINATGFNQLILRRECCSFSNGEYVKLGMAELESWLQLAGEDWVGEVSRKRRRAAPCLGRGGADGRTPFAMMYQAFEELRHLRQAVNFLVIDKKQRKTYDEIKEDLCKDLTVQQIYRQVGSGRRDHLLEYRARDLGLPLPLSPHTG